MIYALDTNIVISLLNGEKVVEDKRNEVVGKGVRFSIPPIVDYEIRRGFFYKPSRKKEPLYFSLAHYCGIGDMTSQAWLTAARIYAELRRNGITVDDADILIAAFCIVNDYTLVTNNVKHFKNIGGLKFENWMPE